MAIRSASQSGLFSNKSTSAQRSQRAGTGFFDAEWVVIGGGGAGGKGYAAGGGGAGGYLGTSSSANVAMPSAKLPLNVPLTVTVGAGGASSTPANTPPAISTPGGSDTIFGALTAQGGGGGSYYSMTPLPGSAGPQPSQARGQPGGSGGGACGRNSNPGSTGYAGTTAQTVAARQGYNGAQWGPAGYNANAPGVGGGGSGGGSATNVRTGGQAVTSSITGSPVARAGGGAGGGPGSSGGTTYGGGGAGGYPAGSAQAGTANTGGGGGGAHSAFDGTSGGGGSGIVIVRWLTADAVARVGSGLTASEATDGDYTVLTITAGSDTVTWV